MDGAVLRDELLQLPLGRVQILPGHPLRDRLDVAFGVLWNPSSILQHEIVPSALARRPAATSRMGLDSAGERHPMRGASLSASLAAPAQTSYRRGAVKKT